MTHPLFRKEIFVETAFAKRLQKMLYASWDNRSWHLIVADPGAGKSMTIRDLQKRAGGRSVLAVVAPKNNDDEQALGDQLLAALGLPIRGHWSTRKPKLMGHLHQYGTEFLIVDDAHDLSLEHLMLLKEVTDQGKLQYDHPLGLCLVAAGRGDTIPDARKHSICLTRRGCNSDDALTNSPPFVASLATPPRKCVSSSLAWSRCTSPSFHSSTCTNGRAASMAGLPIQSWTQPTQAVSIWTIS
jgi:hypothetical protein